MNKFLVSFFLILLLAGVASAQDSLLLTGSSATNHTNYRVAAPWDNSTRTVGLSITGSSGGLTSAALLALTGTAPDFTAGDALLSNTAAYAITSAGNPSPYLFSVLSNYDPSGPKEYVSSDAVNPTPVTGGGGHKIFSIGAGNFRDPAILHTGTTFWMSYTPNAALHGIGLMRSSDLQSWTPVATPDWSAYQGGGLNNIWQGGWFLDPNTGIQYQYWCASDYTTKDTPYVSTFNPLTTGSYGTPAPVIITPTPVFGDIAAAWVSGTSYYALMQDGSNHCVTVLQGSSPTSFTVTSSTFANMESGSIIPITGGFRAYFVTFASGGIFSSTTSNCTTWSTPVQISQGLASDWVNVVQYPDSQYSQAVANLARNGLTAYYNDLLGNIFLDGVVTNPLWDLITGANNTAIGGGSGTGISTGFENTLLGADAAPNQTTAVDNTVAGFFGMHGNTTGGYNTALGCYALQSNSTGVSNEAIGNTALGFNTTGGHNVALGELAGGGYNTPAGNTTGSYNTFLGSNTNIASGQVTNATAIGANAIIQSSNTIVLGGTAANAVTLWGGTTTGYQQIPTVSVTATPPTNTTTPVAWGTVVLSGTTYKLPLYQ